MALKNYTSQIPAYRSISYIEAKLIASGAKQILKDCNNNHVTSISFMINIDGIDIPFKLPARIAECEKILRADIKRPNPEKEARIKEQAERTAWKILYDWVEIQMSMIELAQVEIMEVFLPYVFNVVTQKTYFESIKQNGFKKLLPKPE